MSKELTPAELRAQYEDYLGTVRRHSGRHYHHDALELLQTAREPVTIDLLRKHIEMPRRTAQGILARLYRRGLAARKRIASEKWHPFGYQLVGAAL